MCLLIGIFGPSGPKLKKGGEGNWSPCLCLELISGGLAESNPNLNNISSKYIPLKDKIFFERGICFLIGICVFQKEYILHTGLHSPRKVLIEWNLLSSKNTFYSKEHILSKEPAQTL